MALLIRFFLFAICAGTSSFALSPSEPDCDTPTESDTIIALSRLKWVWMAERNIEALDRLFDTQAMFVHMGGSMNKEQELDVIRSGGIHYKHAEIHETSLRFIGDTAILLCRLQLDAVVGGNEVTNPFTVTEVYVRIGADWKLGCISFTRMLR
ncbi:MAG TPA: nuclear transport factor 2 family protein [Opitutales bacterium]|nr:nuclear transport factor 2 family protein [Opitutales bacterium]